jgi:hypothetical protein
MKKWLLLSVLIISGCAVNPASQYTPEELTEFSDATICQYYNQGASHKLYDEVIRRGINCDPAYQYCIQNGFKKGDEAFLYCMADYRAAIAQQQAIQAQRQQALSQTLMGIVAATAPQPRPVYNTQCINTPMGVNCTTR